MAVSTLTLSTLATSMFTDTVNGATAIAVKASAATVYNVEIDNTANAAITYVKLFNLAAASVTVGTTVPDVVIMVPLSVKISFVIALGWSFPTALSVCSVTTGGTVGATPPSSAVVVKIAFT
jgi:hypothetical protein